MFFRNYNVLDFCSRLHYCNKYKFLSSYPQHCNDGIHAFKQCPFNNYDQLTDSLLDNIIYKNQGLIIVNRPYGLQKYSSEHIKRDPLQKKICIHPTPSVETLSHLSFSEAIPYIEKKLSIAQLFLVKAPDRYMSGISLLCTSHAAQKLIQKAFLPPHLSFCTYLGICHGLPIRQEDNICCGLTLKIQGQNKRVVFVQNYSKKSLQKQLVLPFRIRHRVLSYNKDLDVSLVELTNNRNKWHGIRAYCAQHLLSPILGDHIFGPYVKKISGIRTAANVMNFENLSQYKVPRNILEALQLSRHEKEIIPVHMHFSMLNFLKYQKGKGKVFVARPCDHFLWSCDKLGLEVPAIYLKNTALNEIPESFSAELNNNLHNEDNNDNHSDRDEAKIVGCNPLPTSQHKYDSSKTPCNQF